MIDETVALGLVGDRWALLAVQEVRKPPVQRASAGLPTWSLWSRRSWWAGRTEPDERRNRSDGTLASGAARAPHERSFTDKC